MRKIIIITICIVLSITAIMASVQAINFHHLNHCCVEDCDICNTISNAINFLKNINCLIEYIVILNIVSSLMSIIKTKESKNELNTLINKKVQFNE